MDAALDVGGDVLTDWCGALQCYAELRGVKWGTYHVGQVPTGVEVGAGKSESRTRCYDARLKHPDEFPGPTCRLEHEWKPERKERKELAYTLDASTVLGTSKAASLAVQQMQGRALPAAPPRTERVSDLERWRRWMRETHAARVAELLEHHGGDPAATIFDLLGY